MELELLMFTRQVSITAMPTSDEASRGTIFMSLPYPNSSNYPVLVPSLFVFVMKLSSNNFDV
ncbi:hypothetical protein VCRA2120E57_110094 [Vibrio crassostreae]|nr:hypothetical protein VCRA2120E57_110094 [Vibrio crassostreae]